MIDWKFLRMAGDQFTGCSLPLAQSLWPSWPLVSVDKGYSDNSSPCNTLSSINTTLTSKNTKKKQQQYFLKICQNSKWSNDVMWNVHHIFGVFVLNTKMTAIASKIILKKIYCFVLNNWRQNQFNLISSSSNWNVRCPVFICWRFLSCSPPLLVET